MTPALVINPDKTALAGVGATGWAVGSQACKGTSPALAPKPTRVKKVTIKIMSSDFSEAIRVMSKTPPGVKSIETP